MVRRKRHTYTRTHKRYLKHDDDAWLADDDTQVEVVEPHPMQIEDDIDIPVSLFTHTPHKSFEIRR